MAGQQQCKPSTTSGKLHSKQSGALPTSDSAKLSPGGGSRLRHCSMHVNWLAALLHTCATSPLQLPLQAGRRLCSTSSLKAAEGSSWQMQLSAVLVLPWCLTALRYPTFPSQVSPAVRQHAVALMTTAFATVSGLRINMFELLAPYIDILSIAAFLTPCACCIAGFAVPQKWANRHVVSLSCMQMLHSVLLLWADSGSHYVALHFKKTRLDRAI